MRFVLNRLACDYYSVTRELLGPIPEFWIMYSSENGSDDRKSHWGLLYELLLTDYWFGPYATIRIPLYLQPWFKTQSND